MFRFSRCSPASSVDPEKRGEVVGRFCRSCGGIYPLYRQRHTGKSIDGRDHISPPCAHEGERFETGDDWFEDAVRVLD